MVKWLPDQTKGKHGGEEATSTCVEDSLRVWHTYEYMWVCFCVSVCINVGDCAAYMCVCTPCCLSFRPWATTVYIHKAEQGWHWVYVCVWVCVCLCVCVCLWMCLCVGGEAGVLAVFGFQRLTSKLFIFWRFWGLVGGTWASALVCGHVMFFMGQEQSEGEEVKGRGGRRAGEEVTAPPVCSIPPPSHPTIPLPKTPSHHHRREKRRLLDHRPPREVEPDRDTDRKTDRH